ncbi:hypothetical protein PMAYCL1PPCAC_07746, partial [Pristionchus mayeri]
MHGESVQSKGDKDSKILQEYGPGYGRTVEDGSTVDGSEIRRETSEDQIHSSSDGRFVAGEEGVPSVVDRLLRQTNRREDVLDLILHSLGGHSSQVLLRRFELGDLADLVLLIVEGVHSSMLGRERKILTWQRLRYNIDRK